MATASSFQYKQNMSINRDGFMQKVVLEENLKKKELRVLLHLLTHLDAKNPKKISKSSIAEDLNISKSDVTNAINTLLDLDIIEWDSSGSIRGGYLLTF